MRNSKFKIQNSKFLPFNFKLLTSNSESGQILILAIIALALIIINSISLIGRALTFNQSTTYSTETLQSVNLAEAGIDKAVASLNSTGGTYNGDAETVLGVGSFEVIVSTKNPATKIVESTGYIPSKSAAKTKKTIKIEVSKGHGVAFSYGVQVGDGGLDMGQQGTINGSIYSNGNVIIGQQSEITGDVYVAGGTQPSADQQHDCISPGPNCLSYDFGKNISGQNRLDIAQSFKPSQTLAINKVSLKLKKVGAGPHPNLTVRILSDSSGNPNKNNILASGILSSGLVSSQFGFADVTFSTAPTLTAGVSYWIVIDTSSNNTNYWSWDSDSLQGYTCGSNPPCLSKWSANWQASSPVWTNISGDFAFKVFMGGINTSITGGNNVEIGGNAHANTLRNLSIDGGAYYQSSQNITAGSLYPGSPDPQPLPMPISEANIAEWKDQADNNVFTGNITNCPTSLPSGKYVGSITLPSNCTVTVYSPIWITGNFSMNQQGKLKLHDSYGFSSGMVITDGFISLQQQNKLQGSCGQDKCDNGSYLILLSEFNSRDDPLHRYAIHVHQQGNTGVLYSNLGTVRVDQQNNFTELTAWKVSLDQQIDITYDQGLAGAFFSTGPTGAFSVIKGSYQQK